jgi:hypothetical protein
MNLPPFDEIAEPMQRALLNEKQNFLLRGGQDSKERTLQGLTLCQQQRNCLEEKE